MQREYTVSIFCIAFTSEIHCLEESWLRNHWPAPMNAVGRGSVMGMQGEKEMCNESLDS